MDHSTVSLLIHRIASGKFYFDNGDIHYVFVQPSSELKYRSELIYKNYIENNKYDFIWSKENINKLLSYLDLWNDNNEKYLQDLEQKIENLKLDMYNNRIKKEVVAKLKKDLKFAKESVNKMLNKKHCLDYLTIEDCAGGVKNEFIMVNTIYNANNNLIFSNNMNDVSYASFNNIASCIASNLISIDDYKYVARSEQWKAIWNSNKNNLFGNSSAYDLSDEQKTLISISNMYDKIYEHPECPEDYIINDDDMLDGWMIYQKNKSKQAKKQNMAQELANKHKNAKEIFVVADREDAHSIMELNSTMSSSIIKQRRSVIKASSDSGVDEVNLPDVQMDLLRQVNRR